MRKKKGFKMDRAKNVSLFPPPGKKELPIKIYELQEMVNKLCLYVKGANNRRFKLYMEAINGLSELIKLEYQEIKQNYLLPFLEVFF